jgi:flagellar operon protein
MSNQIARVAPRPASAPSAAPNISAAPDGQPSFEAVLAAEQAQGLRFSSHAQQRLARRGIDLAPTDLARINQAVDQASAKGGRESLILLDELALIVSINNRTVITAMNTGAAGSVFTNVDSVVIAPRTGD